MYSKIAFASSTRVFQRRVSSSSTCIRDQNGGANFIEGAGPTAAPSNTTAVLRNANGCTDTDSNAADFTVGGPSPRNTASPTNTCVGDQAPFVSSTSPTNGAVEVSDGSNVTVSFSEPVNVAGSWFTISCALSSSHTASVSGGPTTFTLDPEVDFTSGESCTVTVIASQVSDQDADDPPDNMTVNAGFAFTTVLPVTLIHDIQGSGASSPVVGSVAVIEGVVVGDFQDTSECRGFYVQEEDAQADANPQTSEGIFVFVPGGPAVAVGDVVRVGGTVTEFNGLTELSSVASVIVGSSGNPLPASTAVSLPVTNVTDFEVTEGMRVTVPQSLVISEYSNYERFGELVLGLPLAGESRLYTGTAIDEPGAPALARAQANSLRRITLDDGLSTQSPNTLRHPNGGNFALNDRFRGGDTVQNVTGVMDYQFGLYRIQPTGPADYTAVNRRIAAPEPVGGDLRVAAMNTLNFFLTQDYPTGNPLDNKCGPAQNVECRGADFDQPTEFTRQRDKLLAALAGLDADIIGLNELENTTGVDPLGDATNGIVAGLNAQLGAGTYAYINTGVIGTDAIRVGLIYKPADVTPVGAFQILDSSDDPRFIDTKSRPALAQTFEENATGARFTVVVNHLKSKGSACDDVGDPDMGDGQGNCNGTRTLAAQALVDWLATDPTGSGDVDFLIMGDLNSYAKEDPIDAIKLGADDTTGTTDDFTNLVAKYGGAFAYSFVFDGQAGYLDHALASPTLTAQVTGATEWHINADEPDLLDYDTSFKPLAQEAIYEPNAYRSSDHDAVVLGLDLRTWSFTGFFQPVDNAPVFNTVKAGQGVPVKFSLSGNQGLGIFAAGYPKSVAIACPSATSTDSIEATTAGKSGLSYDRDTDTYTYVWKTNKAWANTCRQLILVLKDGTIHVAYFQLK